MVCGLPGSGKTMVSKVISELTGAPILRTDVIRKELIEKPTYSPEEMDYIYEQLSLRASDIIKNKDSVIADAVFWSEKNRASIKKIALENNIPLVIVNVTCNEAIIKERIQQRKNDASDADFKIYCMYRDKFEPIVGDYKMIDNSYSESYTRKQIEEILQ